MATAMAFPEGGIGGRGKQSINPELSSGFTDRYLRMARYVLRNSPMVEGERPMSEMIQAGFDYAVLPVESAIVARTAAERIRLRLKRTVEDIIEIGRELTEVKAELPHGQFLPWIEAEFEMSERTARDFMQAHERFGGKSAIIADFKPTILYALAAPSTPESVIDKAIKQAESGDKVTVADVKQWKEAAQVAYNRRAQRAMRLAVMFPDTRQGKRNDLAQECAKLAMLSRRERQDLNMCRFVLHHNEPLARLILKGHPNWRFPVLPPVRRH